MIDARIKAVKPFQSACSDSAPPPSSINLDSPTLAAVVYSNHRGDEWVGLFVPATTPIPASQQHGLPLKRMAPESP
ncbi:hypothetical protein AVEN_67272-1 [Araneus ventricosus]|uniref:Uncharacterized protein n=1 Tax=Araneus ventricosus TaxID=182803 RepID=A0A4Y2ND31_ARAVE|nr:hypothetical protein AVEN_67272-1 [Araneus ventricosus]